MGVGRSPPPKFVTQKNGPLDPPVYEATSKGAHNGRAHGPVPQPIRLEAHGRKGPKDGQMRSKSPSRASLAVIRDVLWLNWAT